MLYKEEGDTLKSTASYYSTKIDIGNLQLNVALPGLFFDGIIERECDMHVHSGFELHYVYNGMVELETDDGVIVLRRNVIYLIPPFKYHSVKNSSEDLKQITFVFNFKENKNAEFENDIYSKYNTLFSQSKNIRTVNAEAVYFDDLFECITRFNRESELDHEIMRAFLLLIFKIVVDGISTEGGSKPDGDKLLCNEKVSDVVRAKQIDDYMYDHYKNEVSIEGLAKYLHLSVRQTSRFLKNYVGINFNDFIREYRIEHAKKLLVQNELSPEKIAFEVGYRSYNGFSEAFLKVVGMRPKQYAEKYNTKNKQCQE